MSVTKKGTAFKYFTSEKAVMLYNIVIFFLALVSVLLAIVDLLRGLRPAELWIDRTIYGVFVVDYAVRFLITNNKQDFFKSNIIDLIAIIPLNSAFRGLRLLKMSKLLKLTKLVRIGALSARSASKARRFFNTNGFKYVICLSVAAILGSSCAMMYFEKMSFQDAVWWSFVTATTVGYGDLSPSTLSGRIIASLLMLIGIGLIGSLTSTITSYFLNETAPDECKSDKVEMVFTLYGMLSDKEKELFQSKIK